MPLKREYYLRAIPRVFLLSLEHLSLERFNFQIRLPVEKRRQKQKKTYRSLVFSVLNFITSNGNFASKIRLTRSSTPFYIDNTPKYINLSFSPVTNQCSFNFRECIFSLYPPPPHTYVSRDQN